MTRHPIPSALALLTLLAAVATLATDALPAGPLALAIVAAWGLGAMILRRMR